MTPPRRAELAQRRRRLIAYGRWEPLAQVDPRPASEHLAFMRATYRLSIPALADLTGVGDSIVAALLYPSHHQARTWITQETADACLSAAFDLDKLAPNRRVDATGTRRRLQSLARDGWSLSHIARLRGGHVQVLSHALRQPAVEAFLAREIRDIYLELEGRDGPCRRAARYATTRGWLTRAMWDAESMDNPTTRPALDDNLTVVDEVAIARALRGDQVTLTGVERDRVVLEGTLQGWSATQLSDVVGRSAREVQRIRARLRAQGLLPVALEEVAS